MIYFLLCYTYVYTRDTGALYEVGGGGGGGVGGGCDGGYEADK